MTASFRRLPVCRLRHGATHLRWEDDEFMTQPDPPQPGPDPRDSPGSPSSPPQRSPLAPDQVSALVHADIPVTEHLGLKVLELQPGFVRLLMPFEPNRNHLGTMYAGSLVALAEIPGGLLPMSMPELAVLLIAAGLEVKFLRAVRSDAYLTVGGRS